MQFGNRSQFQTMPRTPLDPNLRRAIYGPVHSMDEKPSLLSRIFGYRRNLH